MPQFAVGCRAGDLSKIFHAQSTSLNDAFERSNWDRLAAVHGDDHLPAVRVPPFLMAAFLADHAESVAPQDSDNVFGAANWEALAHSSATSSIFAPAGRGIGDGSSQSSNASLALSTASSSVSPAEAHPGNSGKKAAHRLLSGSYSTTNRSFMQERLTSKNT